MEGLLKFMCWEYCWAFAGGAEININIKFLEKRCCLGLLNASLRLIGCVVYVVLGAINNRYRYLVSSGNFHADAAGLIIVGVYSSGKRAGNKKYCTTQPFTLMRWNSHDGLWVLIEGRDWSRQAPPMFHGFHVEGNFVFQNCLRSCGP